MKCLVCGSEDFKRTTLGGCRFNDRDYYYFRCQSCLFIQIDPVPSDEEISLLYGKDYYKNYYVRKSKKLGFIENKEQALKNARQFLKFVKRFKKNGLLLDIGCAGGFFLLAARESGFQVQGLEQNLEMADFARDKLNLNVAVSNTSKILDSEKFDIVHYGDVINNLNDPEFFVCDSVRLLKKGGLLVVEGAIAFNSSLAQAVHNYIHSFKDNPLDWVSEGSPYELWHFNSRNLGIFFGKFGLRILKIKIFEEPARPFAIEKELGRLIDKRIILSHMLKDFSSIVGNLFFKDKGDRYWLAAQKI